MSKIKLFSLHWSDAKYLDLWSIVHFLSGVIAGSFFGLLDFSFWTAFGLTAAVAIIYEYGEKIFGVSEDWENILIDIALALLGYVIYYYEFSEMTSAFHWRMLIIVGAINGILTYMGYLNFRKRHLTAR